MSADPAQAAPPPDTSALAAIVQTHYPALRGAAVSLSHNGFDSVALSISTMTFKFPREAAAIARLRREAAILDVIGSQLAMPVPRLHIHEGPPVFSAHETLPGQPLLTEDYLRLTPIKRRRLAADLGRFFAQTHALTRTDLAGAAPQVINRWRPLPLIEAEGLPLVPVDLRGMVRTQLARFAALPHDPLGTVFGHFDAHGWNMAFDPVAGRLNGIFDFADAGFAPAHEDWLFPSMIHPRLAKESMLAYSALTGRTPDWERVRALTTVHRLDDLAGADEYPPMAPLVRQISLDWFRYMASEGAAPAP